jgi:iron(III) transport system ATP-binding protein
MAILEKMELDHLARRQATKLSGGQQRLALARALVTEPALVLLDEPLSNLDAKLRESMRFELKRLQRDLGLRSVYVTHDQVEALALSSRLAVIREGRVEQIGTPHEIYRKPANRFVAGFIGTSKFITGTATAREDGLLTVTTGQGRLRVAPVDGVVTGDRVTLAVRPESVGLSEEQPRGTMPNEFTGEVVTQRFLGDAVDHLVTVNTLELRARVHPHRAVSAGQTVTLHIDPADITLIPVVE